MSEKINNSISRLHENRVTLSKILSISIKHFAIHIWIMEHNAKERMAWHFITYWNLITRSKNTISRRGLAAQAHASALLNIMMIKESNVTFRVWTYSSIINNCGRKSPASILIMISWHINQWKCFSPVGAVICFSFIYITTKALQRDILIW